MVTKAEKKERRRWLKYDYLRTRYSFRRRWRTKNERRRRREDGVWAVAVYHERGRKDPVPQEED